MDNTTFLTKLDLAYGYLLDGRIVMAANVIKGIIEEMKKAQEPKP